MSGSKSQRCQVGAQRYLWFSLIFLPKGKVIPRRNNADVNLVDVDNLCNGMSRPSSSKNYNFAFPLVTCGCLSVSREPRRYPCHLRTVWLRLRHSKSWVNGQLSSCPGCVQRLSHSHIIHIWIFQFSIFTIVCYLCVTYCPQIVPFILAGTDGPQNSRST